MQVRVLGRLAATAGGAALPVEALPRRARQVLSVLAARYDRVQSKHALADAVWGAQPPGNHAAAVEHYVSLIRRTLQPGRPTTESFIVTRGGGYLLTTSRADLDLAEVRRLVRWADSHAPGSADRLRARQQILDLATDLPFPDDDDAGWAAAPRTEVRGAVLAALLELGTAALGADPERALRLSREAVELDGYLEPAYRLAMRAAAALGRSGEALRWYARCRDTLAADLGVTPSPETATLRAEIQTARRTPVAPGVAVPASAGPTSAAPAADPAAPPDGRARHAVGAAARRPATVVRLPVPPPAPPFLGRRVELDLILGAQPVPVVHVVGPTGAGKSALLAELTRRAPGRVGVGAASATAGPLRLSWLHSALAGLGADGAVRAALDAATAQGRPLNLDELEQVAAGLARRVPVVLAVDDAGELDETSATELAWLGRRCPTLCLTVSYRYPSEITERPVAALGAGVVLRLPALSEQELAGSEIPDALERTGGIPALVAVLRRPPAVAASVAMHVARVRSRWMPRLAWEILRVTAALGSLRVGELAVLTGRPLAEVLACVDQLVHAHLVTEGPGGHVRHRAGLIRAAVAEQVSTAHGVHLRERLAALGG